MSFNSYLFLLGFFPVFYIAYRFIPPAVERIAGGRRPRLKEGCVREAIILAGSFCFLAASGIRLLILLTVGCLVNYGIAGMIFRRESHHARRRKKLWLAAGICLNILVLAMYKYMGVFLSGQEELTAKFSILQTVSLPLGISFVTFQQIAWLVDMDRGDITELRLIDYLFYVTYFPKYVQGPITRYEDLIGQIHDQEGLEQAARDSSRKSTGLWMLAEGLGRKVLLADTLGKGVDWAWSNIETLNGPEAVVAMIGYTLQIYFDFGGYSRMALGISCLLGIDLPDNFDRPYRADSVNEFWKRWHITLTSFLRDYLYIPLGGNRKGKFRTCLNIMIVFLISGLWHGSGWNFLVWGALHGAASCLDRFWKTGWRRLSRGMRVIFTFLFVNIAWVFFRAPSAGEALSFLSKIINPASWNISDVMEETHSVLQGDMLEALTPSVFHFLSNIFPPAESFLKAEPWVPALVVFAIALPAAFVVRDKKGKERITVVKTVMTVAILFFSIISLSSVSQFIYGTF